MPPGSDLNQPVRTAYSVPLVAAVSALARHPHHAHSVARRVALGEFDDVSEPEFDELLAALEVAEAVLDGDDTEEDVPGLDGWVRERIHRVLTRGRERRAKRKERRKERKSAWKERKAERKGLRKEMKGKKGAERKKLRKAYHKVARAHIKKGSEIRKRDIKTGSAERKHDYSLRKDEKKKLKAGVDPTIDEVIADVAEKAAGAVAIRAAEREEYLPPETELPVSSGSFLWPTTVPVFLRPGFIGAVVLTAAAVGVVLTGEK